MIKSTLGFPTVVEGAAQVWFLLGTVLGLCFNHGGRRPSKDTRAIKVGQNLAKDTSQ